MKIEQAQQRQVLNLNNQAVAHLQAGQSKEAMTALRLAASILRDRFPESSREDANEEQQNSSKNKNNNSTCTSSSTSSSSSSSPPATEANPTQCKEEESSCRYGNMEVEQVVVSDQQPQPQPQPQPMIRTPLVHSVPAHLKYNNPNNNNTKSAASFSFYNRALVVSSVNKSSAADAEILSGVILYNMGLVNHLHGLSRGLDAFIDQAMRLYQTALSIMQACYNEGMDHDDDDDDDDGHNNNNSTIITMEQEEAHFQSTSFILLALFNNSAQIYSHYCQREGMSYSLDCMRHVLGASSPAGQNYSSMALQQEHHHHHHHHHDHDHHPDDYMSVGREQYQSYSFFYMNAMVFSSVDSLALAAAA